MSPPTEMNDAPKRSGLPNNIGFLRLLLASAVIVGHSPEMIDGNRAREPLTVLFHTMNLGGLAVDGFFLLSGYLITKSMLSTQATWPYLERRILRIYPAFLVAYALCVFVLAPLVGASVGRHLFLTIFNMGSLRAPPDYPGAFPGLPYHGLNGSMWTIRVEFECYLMILAFWWLGLLRRRSLILILAAVITATAALLRTPFGEPFQTKFNQLSAVYFLLGPPFPLLTLVGVFLIGACFYFYREVLIQRVNALMAAGSAVIATVALYRDPVFAEAALTTFGAVALFWLAFKANLGVLQSINDRWDISYGVYLYGWPAGMCLLYFLHVRSPVMLAFSALVASLLLGAASWWGIERWAKDLVRSRSRPASGASASVEQRTQGPSLARASADIGLPGADRIGLPQLDSPREVEP